jgi:hypothetical protein
MYAALSRSCSCLVTATHPNSPCRSRVDEQKKEGYLAEKTLWGFKKRFCVLKDGILFVFAEKVLLIHASARTLFLMLHHVC